MRFKEWEQVWRGQSRRQTSGAGVVRWRGLPAASRPFHTHLPVDYLLDNEALGNAAVGGALDGTDAGCEVSELPRPLADEPSEPKPPPRCSESRRAASKARELWMALVVLARFVATNPRR